MHLGCPREKAFRQGRHSLDHMLAVVENKEDPSVGEEGDQTWNRILRLIEASEGRADGGGDESGIGERAQIDEADGLVEIPEQRVGRRNGDSRFTDAAWPDNADKPSRHQDRAQRANRLVAAHHPREVRRQLRELDQRIRGRRCELASRGAMDRADETIPPPGNVGDVSDAICSLTKRFAQTDNVDPQIGVLDRDIGPYALDQRAMTHHLSRALDESNQDVKGTAAYRDRLVPLDELPFYDEQTERAERYSLAHPHAVAIRRDLSCI